MHHHAELAVYSFLQKAMKGESDMAEEIREQVAQDVKAALEKQFSGPSRDEFKPVSYTHLTLPTTSRV